MRLHSIGYRLTGYVLFVALVAILIVIAAAAISANNREQELIDRTISEIREVYVPGIVTTLWAMDHARSEKEITRLGKLRHIACVDLDSRQHSFHVGQYPEGAGVYREEEFPLIYPSGEKLGGLRVSFSLSSVNDAIWDDAVAIGISMVLPFTVMLCAILLLSQRLVTRPLASLSEYARTVTLDTLSEEIPFPNPKSWDDELADLLSSLNTMRHNMALQIQQREEAEQKYRSVFDATMEALFIHDGESGCLVDVNRRMLELYKCTREQALSMTVRDFSAASSDDINNNALRLIRQAVQGDELLFEWHARDLEGRNFWSEVGMTKTKIGNRMCVVASVRDITERREMESHLRHSQKMDAIGQLAGGVAHDFNNMLGGIIGSSELLQKLMPDDPMAQQYLSMILESAERAADLAAKLLAFSRRQVIGSTPIDIHRIIRDTVSLLENTIDKRVEVRLDLVAEHSTIVGDNTQLQSVFLNLGINSSHAMPSGGVLSYSSRLIELSEAYCRASTFELAPGNYIQVEVQDTGCGIPLENLSHIFEPFYTTKEQGKGTGLGLAAAYGTMQQHKGAISVYSEEGKGTCFHLLFPLTEEASSLHSSKGQASVRGEGLILLVDDEPVMRATGQALLEELGYTVLLAENGKIAVEVFRENQKAINLVVLDMIMPDMNGRDCFAVLKSLRADVPIVLASGFTREEDIANLKEQGLSGFIQKPFRGVELSRVVAEALGKEKK